MIKKIFKNLFRTLICEHEWNFLRRTSHYADDGKYPYKTTETYRCKKCLKTKRVRI